MARRKGEMSSSQLDREYPFQIAVPARAVIGRWAVIHGAHDRGHSVFYEGEWWNVYCFPTHELAEAFGRKADGCWFDPRDRGRGNSWMKWTPKEKPLSFREEARMKERKSGG